MACVQIWGHSHSASDEIADIIKNKVTDLNTRKSAAELLCFLSDKVGCSTCERA